MKGPQQIERRKNGLLLLMILRWRSWRGGQSSVVATDKPVTGEPSARVLWDATRPPRGCGGIND